PDFKPTTQRRCVTGSGSREYPRCEPTTRSKVSPDIQRSLSAPISCFHENGPLGSAWSSRSTVSVLWISVPRYLFLSPALPTYSYVPGSSSNPFPELCKQTLIASA